MSALCLMAAFCLLSSTAFAQDADDADENSVFQANPVLYAQNDSAQDSLASDDDADDDAFDDDDDASDADDDAFDDDDEFDDEDDEIELPTGKLLYVGLETPMLLDKNTSNNIAVVTGGIHVKLGYRWEHTATFLEQSFAVGASLRDGDKDGVHYMASTYWIFAAYGAITQNWILNFDIGIGAIYGDHDSVTRSGNYGCASVKFEIGLEYRITNTFSLGVNFAYALGIVEQAARVEKAKDGLLHYLYPTVGFTYAF